MLVQMTGVDEAPFCGMEHLLFPYLIFTQETIPMPPNHASYDAAQGLFTFRLAGRAARLLPFLKKEK
ncbi:hypothetical protein EDM56_00680 [Brevibacillus fluminis]|uniref:Uncharacterized protein n=1 Tax=Brevibacillus fluminis TaxID=511487 RepID=A0A3M8DYE7_9BACL|nr:hypothetical protein EDM56_00680 [Brevibacillus fluminis]